MRTLNQNEWNVVTGGQTAAECQAFAAQINQYIADYYAAGCPNSYPYDCALVWWEIQSMIDVYNQYCQ